MLKWILRYFFSGDFNAKSSEKLLIFILFDSFCLQLWDQRWYFRSGTGWTEERRFRERSYRCPWTILFRRSRWSHLHRHLHRRWERFPTPGCPYPQGRLNLTPQTMKTTATRTQWSDLQRHPISLVHSLIGFRSE